MDFYIEKHPKFGRVGSTCRAVSPGAGTRGSTSISQEAGPSLKLTFEVDLARSEDGRDAYLLRCDIPVDGVDGAFTTIVHEVFYEGAPLEVWRDSSWSMGMRPPEAESEE